jgi:hypothetical protein
MRGAPRRCIILHVRRARTRTGPHPVPSAGDLVSALLWLGVLALTFVACRLGGGLLARHHGDSLEVAGVLVVGLSAVGGMAWAGAESTIALALVAVASAAGLFDGYRRAE